ncbi:MAG: undecaprenyldiphospho-muramoylpentapeptide beta-N-acetylglucosaminyltransferase [Anaerolineaceae bacterium]
MARLLICAGGTGGGVYPALSILQALTDRIEEILWVGGINGMENELVSRQNIPFRSIPAAGLHGVGLRSLPGNLYKLAQGISASTKILREFQPDVLLFTGGYVAVPMALAGRSIPQVLYVPDIEPGLALKGLSRFADVITLTTPDSKKYFSTKKNLVVTGYPIRTDLKKFDRVLALQQMKLKDNSPVLLIVGGSKGARLMNQAVMQVLPELLKDFQVIHLTGELDWPEIQDQITNLPAELASKYHAYPYLHEEMAAAFSCADIVLSRAGASTLGELPFYGLPAILVPYPFAWRYQNVNANYLVSKGAALKIENSQLKEDLINTLHQLISDQSRLASMKKAMVSLARLDAAALIADLVLKLANQHNAERKAQA